MSNVQICNLLHPLPFMHVLINLITLFTYIIYIHSLPPVSAADACYSSLFLLRLTKHDLHYTPRPHVLQLSHVTLAHLFLAPSSSSLSRHSQLTSTPIIGIVTYATIRPCLGRVWLGTGTSASNAVSTPASASAALPMVNGSNLINYAFTAIGCYAAHVC